MGQVRETMFSFGVRAALWCFACAFASAAAMPARAATVAPPRPAPIGKELVSPNFTRPAVKVPYPNRVEALFDLTYATVPGYRPLLLDLYRVPGAEPKPSVVFVHGGSFVGGSPRAASTPVFGETDAFMAYVASRGYVVAAISYRLASEAKWPAQLQDAKAAIRWLRANAATYGIDPERVAVWGESAGASIASMVGTTCGVAELEGQGNLEQSSCVQGVVDWYGATDMAQLDAQAPPNAALVHNSPDSSQSKVLGCVLHFECPASVVAKANPIAYLDAGDAKVSFLIQHGDDDKAISWKQGQLFYDALRAQGVPARLDIVPGADHYFTGVGQEQIKRVLDTFFAFLAESLGGKTRGNAMTQSAPPSSGPTAGTAANPVLAQKVANAKPGELRVIATAAIMGPLEAVRARAEKAVGRPIVIEYGSARGNLKNEALAGQPFEVALLLPDVDQELLAAGKIEARTHAIARVPVAIAFRGDVPPPDVGTPAALKEAMLKAHSVRYAPTGAARDTVTKVLTTLGVADAIKDTSKGDQFTPIPLAPGEYEIGFYPLSEILPNKNVRNLGLVPEPLQVPVVLEASIGKQANDARAAAAFVKFLQGPAIDASLDQSGMIKAGQ